MFYTMQDKISKYLWSRYENTLGPADRNDWTKDQANQGTHCVVRAAVPG